MTGGSRDWIKGGCKQMVHAMQGRGGGGIVGSVKICLQSLTWTNKRGVLALVWGGGGGGWADGAKQR